jgi:hypothetical protein
MSPLFIANKYTWTNQLQNSQMEPSRVVCGFVELMLSEKRRALRYRLSVIFTTKLSVNDLDQAWCRGNLRCHNDMHSQL